MCGIVGYLGKKTNLNNIINKLKKLEYRGYDSAGFWAANNKKTLILKSVGNIEKLKKTLPNDFETTIAIAHTRWATHGKPSEKNCHPHISQKAIWNIVHNGIIENYKQIKEKLKNKPDSDCDTAVLAQFLEESNVTNIKSFIDCFNNVQGSYAVVAIKKDEEKLYLAKDKSPLYLASFDDGVVVASDPICFPSQNKSYYSLEDGEFAEISRSKIIFYDKNKKILQKTTKNTQKMLENCDKMVYKHYMLKEIYEQKDAILRLVQVYKHTDILSKMKNIIIKNMKKIIILGCGTAYHAALVGARYIEEIANIPTEVEIASEFVYKSPIFIDENTVVIAVSQSGETADTIKAVEIAKKYKAKTIALTNVEYSTIASKVDFLLPVCAGPEIAVASTKAYVCQLCALFIFANYLSLNKNKMSNTHYREIEELAEYIINFDKNEIDDIAEEIIARDDCIFIGKNIDYITAKEASLKLKEISYINATNYPSGELKHGFLAMVTEGTPLFVFATQQNINHKSYNAACEAEARGAKKYIITNEKINAEKNAKIIKIKCKNKYLAAIEAIVPLQYLAYKVSILKNINPDQPRNLAKSVTVE